MDDRAVRVELRVKNARLLDAIEERWGKIIDKVWNSQGSKRSARPVVQVSAQLAQVHTSSMGNFLRMATPAYRTRDGKPIPTAERIVEALDGDMEYLFPPELCSKSIPMSVQYLSQSEFVSLSEISSREAITPSPDDDKELVKSERFDVVDSLLLNVLSPRERLVLRGRYGFDGEPQTLQQIAVQLALERERIRQIEAKALRLLKTSKGGVAKLRRVYKP